MRPADGQSKLSRFPWLICFVSLFALPVQGHSEFEVGTMGNSALVSPENNQWVTVTVLSEERGSSVIRLAVDMDQAKAHSMRAWLQIDRKKGRNPAATAVRCELAPATQGNISSVDVTIAKDLIHDASIELVFDVNRNFTRWFSLEKWLRAKPSPPQH